MTLFRLATGEAPYVADLKFEGMVHGALKFSDHPRAKVLKIDTGKAAEKLEGVLRIIYFRRYSWRAFTLV